MKPQPPVDWEELRRRLHAVRTSVDGDAASAARDEQRILHERAHALAGEPAAETEPGGTIEVVVFDLVGEHYGIALLSVREVCSLKELTPVPCTPAFVLGIINLRGEIHTVIDLKKFFDLPESGISELNKILILESGDMRLGILADAIQGVRTVRLAEMEPSLPTLTGIRADYLRGVTNERLIVLDAARILSDEHLLVHDAAED